MKASTEDREFGGDVKLDQDTLFDQCVDLVPVRCPAVITNDRQYYRVNEQVRQLERARKLVSKYVYMHAGEVTDARKNAIDREIEEYTARMNAYQAGLCRILDNDISSPYVQKMIRRSQADSNRFASLNAFCNSDCESDFSSWLTGAETSKARNHPHAGTLANDPLDPRLLTGLGARLVRTRVEIGLSRTELAERVGISRTQISRYEACLYQCATLERIGQIMEALKDARNGVRRR